MGQPWLVFLHGINTDGNDPWHAVLNEALGRFGYSSVPIEQCLKPDYRSILDGGETGSGTLRSTWERPALNEWANATTAYLARMAFLETRLRPHSNAQPGGFVPPDLADIPPGIPLLDQARRYRSPDVKAAVQRRVLDSLEHLPDRAQVVILGHSLGSVVAADILKKLPAHLHVAALVTIGSPLGSISSFRNHDLDDFPLDRISAWVNVFDPRDPVTGARGIAEHYPWAIDVPVLLPDWVVAGVVHQHGADFYCRHGAVAAAVGESLMGSDLSVVGEQSTSRIDGLELLLLQSLYQRELAKRIPTSDSKRLARLERARHITAIQHASTAQVLHARQATTAPLAAAEFLIRPHAHIRGAWNEAAVLALAISLACGQPASPFEIEQDWASEERRSALVSTLDLIRTHAVEPTDIDIVDAIFAAMRAATDLLSQGRSWVPIALFAGAVAAVTLTGVGLVVAAPAGLAGAALTTSTLAAFGPGGMIGGMATLATLSTATGALAAAGATVGARGTRPGADLLVAVVDEALGTSDPEALRGLLISLLTLVGAQERLQLKSQRMQVFLACANAHAQMAQRVAAHDEIDPKSGSAKAARIMLKLLAKACQWLRGETRPETPEAVEWSAISTRYRDALESRLDRLGRVLPRTGRSDPEPPALTSS